MKWKEKHVMDSPKIHIPLANKNQSYEKKKIDSRKDKRPDENKGDSNFKETVNWDRVKISQP
jgi:hypothetical protein